MIKMKAAGQVSMNQEDEDTGLGILGDENCIHGTPVELIHKGQRCHPAVSGMDPGVKYDRDIAVLEDTT